MDNIWYLDGVDPANTYSKYYDDEYHKQYIKTFVSSDTDAIYNIVSNFTNFEGTVQIFNK